MPIIKSAKKRVRVARKAAARNVRTKRTLKSAIKTFQAALSGKKNAGTAQQKAQSAIDTAVKKGVMHKNKAARKKRQLAAAAKAAGHKTGAKTASAKKTVAKAAPAKSAVKRTAAKSPAKSAAKRTTTKK